MVLIAIVAVLTVFVFGGAHVYRLKRDELARAGIEFPYWCLVAAPPVVFAAVMSMSKLLRSDWDAQIALLVIANVLLCACIALRVLVVRSAR